VSEHDFEPIRGLPGDLPKGETLLWQGAPNWWSLARRAFHIRTVALYFGCLMAWRFGSDVVLAGATPDAALQSALGLAPVAVAALALLAFLALLTARTTVYTITSKRIVLRFGVALPKAINIPFALIESASLKNNSDSTGDIGVTLTKTNKIAYLLLWPHARPWKLTHPQPSMRAVPKAAAVAAQLGIALKAVHADGVVTHIPAPAPEAAPHGALSAA
jgi:hypothetical protein